jgi:hypothetical protein
VTFSWALPSALGLGLLLALPVMAHLTRRMPTDRVAFGAMLLIDRLVKRLRRRRSLKDPWLLLVRLLSVLAAVLAVTGPFVAWQDLEPEYGGSGRVVIVVDKSMSMSMVDSASVAAPLGRAELVGSGTLLARARSEAAERVLNLPRGSKVALIVCGAAAEVRSDALTEDREGVAALIDAVEPGLGGCDLAGSLLAARKLLAGDPGEVLVFSDEAGPVMVPAAAEELERLVAQGNTVLPIPIFSDPPRNVAVLGAEYGDGLEGGQVSLKAANYGPELVEASCDVVLPDGATITVFLSIPANGEAETKVTVPRKADGGVAMARCEDPSLPVDDRRYFHLPSIGASRVIVVDGDPGDSPVKSEVYFLERALAPWGGEQGGVLPDVVAPGGLGVLDPATHRVVFLANVSDPRPEGPQLREFVRKGGSIVIAGGENITAERYNEALGAILPAPIRQPRSLADAAEEPVHLVPPEPDEPLFAPFARAGRSGFGHVGAWRVLTLDPYPETPEVHTLLRYEGGAPALVDRKLGDGHVILWTSTVDLGWSNLPLQAVFMPLVQRLVSVLGGDAGGRAERVSALIGERIEVEVPEGAAVVVLGPDGGPAASQMEGSKVVLSPTAPGGYTVRLDGGPVLAWVAVNVDPVESDVRRTSSIGGVEAAWKPEVFERRVELGPWLFGLALAAALLSAALGLRGTA